MADLAALAPKLVEEALPRLEELLLGPGARPTPAFELVLGPLASGNTGEAHPRSSQVLLDSGSFSNVVEREERFREVLVHEMAHLVAPVWMRWPGFSSRRRAELSGWSESVADFARYRVVGTNGWDCPECNARYSHYSSGYRCGGAFLLAIEGWHGTDVIRGLVRELRQGTYSDAYFQSATGRSLEELWQAFEATAADLPTAREARALRRELGYVGSLPPRDVRARFERLVMREPEEFVRRALAGVKWSGGTRRGIENDLMVYLYLKQPGGPLERHLEALYQAGRLPGLTPDARGYGSGIPGFAEMESRRWPVVRTVECRVTGDPSTYHYTVGRLDVAAPWRLERAWRTDAEGRVVEVYAVPDPVTGER